LISTLPAWGASALRVCANPNNLPFSSRDRKGLENRLAEVLTADLGMKLEYVWREERKNFVEKSLNSGLCDAIMGVPAGLDSVAVTRAYYRSTYVWVARRDRRPAISSLYDDRLAALRVGVHVVDDSYAPPAQVLAQNGLAANLVSYSLFGTAGELNPPARLIKAVSRGDVDVALAWGPLAGYFADPALEITPVTPRRFGLVPFVYDIAVAVRAGNDSLRNRLDGALGRQCAAIQELLREYKFPQIEEGRPLCGSALSAYSAPSFSR
jgi:quinoprotein dehydrogenase-associated probable ABC transporter substrate-binding protein